ncbi:MAG: fructose-6-phosphate aldolase [Treponema sp.]|jgi:TalC/MipB family fructose-6-phosphate aldolase|nr:fructose-6-phosphate aldolase [Treponema sp.]
MELLLDTANLDEIKEGCSYLPVVGVTTNPSIIKKQRPADFFEHLRQMRKVIGPERSLHVQVVADTYDGMMKDTERIFRELGDRTFIKVPVTAEGLRVIKVLSTAGKNVTATAVYSAPQGIWALLNGARYIAVYYNRMVNNGTDADTVIRQLSDMICRSGCDCQILAASFRNCAQVVSAYSNGAEACTVGYDILKSSVGLAAIRSAVDAFSCDWRDVYGNKTIADI